MDAATGTWSRHPAELFIDPGESVDPEEYSEMRETYRDEGYEHRGGLPGRKYNNSDRSLAEPRDFEKLGDTRYHVKISSPAPSETAVISKYRVVRRIKENYNIHNMTLEDLVYIRYAMVEALALRQNDQESTEMQQIFKNRLKYLPDVKDLIMEILPSLKSYAGEEVVENYTKDIGYDKNVGKDDEHEVNYDINSFARRFSTVLMEKVDIPRGKFTGIEKPQYQSYLLKNETVAADLEEK